MGIRSDLGGSRKLVNAGTTGGPAGGSHAVLGAGVRVARVEAAPTARPRRDGPTREAHHLGRGLESDPGRLPVRRSRLGEDDAARSVGDRSKRPFAWVSVDEQGQRPDRSPHVRRGRAGPHLAARPGGVRGAGVARRVRSGDGRAAPGSRSRDYRAAGRPRSRRPAPARQRDMPRRHRGAHETRFRGLAGGFVIARGPGASAGSAEGAGPGAGDRAG